MAEHLMRDWSRCSFDHFDEFMKDYFYDEDKKTQNQDQLERLVRNVQACDAKKDFFKSKNKSIVMAILKLKIVEFDEGMIKSAEKFAISDLN